MNVADSDEMGRHLKERGFISVEAEDGADAVLVNTCTVRELAEHKAMSYIGRLKEWKEEDPGRLVIVTGCAAERAKAEIKHRFPHIDLIVGAKDIEQFPAELDRFLESRHSGESRNPGLKSFSGEGQGLDPGFRRDDDLVPSELTSSNSIIQYVTIMRGCNYNCTSSIVPSVRGREVYRPVEEILSEVRARTEEGAKEIWLLGQTVNSYRPATAGRPASAPRPGYDFSDLLHDASKIPGVERLRFKSPHPYYLTPKLIRAMAESDQVCEHIHLPVQSGSDNVLQRMKRNYTREHYVNGIRALRSAIPDIAITTDIIVGFPGETHEDFLQTLSLVEEAEFDSAYGFKYSPRPGTPSAEWKDDVPLEVKENRVNELLRLTDSQGVARAARLAGTVQEMLVEDDKGGGVFRGKTRGAWRVRVQDSSLKLGAIIPVRITATHSRELHAERLPADSPTEATLRRAENLW